MYKNIGYAECIATVVPNANATSNEFVGFNNHMLGNHFWELRVSSMGLQQREEPDLYSYCVFFKDLEGHGIYPVHLIHADVIPSYLENDIVKMQVTAFPLAINYYEDEETLDLAMPEMNLMGKSLRYCDGIHPVGLFGNDEKSKTVVLLKGKIIEVETLHTFNGEKKTNFISIVVDTQVGTIPLPHTMDFVADEEKHLIKPGSVVLAECILSGDVAIDAYQEGAVFDEENCLRLIRSCMQYGDYDRLLGALSDDCCYTRQSGEKITEKRHIIDKLIKTYHKIKNQKTEHYTYMAIVGKISGGKGNEAKFPIGKRCIAMAANKPDDYYAWLFITTNSDGKITEIETSPSENKVGYSYSVKLDEFEPRGEEAFVGKQIITVRTEVEWLQLIADCYRNFSFDRMEFYFGMAQEVILTSHDGITIKNNKEAVFTYLNEKAKKLHQKSSVLETKVVITELVSNKHGIMIQTKYLCEVITISTNEGGKMSEIRIDKV